MVCFLKCNAFIYIPYIITTYFKCFSEILLILCQEQNYDFIFKLISVFTFVNGLNKIHAPLNINWVLDIGKW